MTYAPVKAAQGSQFPGGVRELVTANGDSVLDDTADAVRVELVDSAGEPAGSSPYLTGQTTYVYATGSITKKVIKASGGTVLHVYATNANASGRWVGIHNKATDPAAADACTSFFIPGGTANNPGWVELPLHLVNATGVGWSIGTTADTFTDAATASQHTIVVEYA